MRSTTTNHRGLEFSVCKKVGTNAKIDDIKLQYYYTKYVCLYHEFEEIKYSQKIQILEVQMGGENG